VTELFARIDAYNQRNITKAQLNIKTSIDIFKETQSVYKKADLEETQRRY